MVSKYGSCPRLNTGGSKSSPTRKAPKPPEASHVEIHQISRPRAAWVTTWEKRLSTAAVLSVHIGSGQTADIACEGSSNTVGRLAANAGCQKL